MTILSKTKPPEHQLSIVYSTCSFCHQEAFEKSLKNGDVGFDLPILECVCLKNSLRVCVDHLHDMIEKEKRQLKPAW